MNEYCMIGGRRYGLLKRCNRKSAATTLAKKYRSGDVSVRVIKGHTRSRSKRRGMSYTVYVSAKNRW